MVDIVQAGTAGQIEDVRVLIRGFVAWARERLAADLDKVDRYFRPELFEPELSGLPGVYAPPRGSLIVAYMDGVAAGCVGMRPLGEGVCEMKRMFVTAEARGKGIGRLLVTRLIGDAVAAGYRVMRLDTSMHQHEAMALYEQAGFRPIGPYYDVPDDLRNWLRYYERAL